MLQVPTRKKRVGFFFPRIGMDTSETPYALDSSGSGETQKLILVVVSSLDKRQQLLKKGRSME